MQWIEGELEESGEDWKIPYFHHPLYSSGRRHGSDVLKRKVLEPLFVKYNVSVVLTGHDHVYERIKPQNGIVYFVVGSGGQLRRGNLRQDRRHRVRQRQRAGVHGRGDHPATNLIFNAIASQRQGHRFGHDHAAETEP